MPDIIMHFPKKQEDLRILQEKIAHVHAEAVIKHIEKVHCPKEQKIDLLKTALAASAKTNAPTKQEYIEDCQKEQCHP